MALEFLFKYEDASGSAPSGSAPGGPSGVQSAPRGPIPSQLPPNAPGQQQPAGAPTPAQAVPTPNPLTVGTPAAQPAGGGAQPVPQLDLSGGPKVPTAGELGKSIGADFAGALKAVPIFGPVISALAGIVGPLVHAHSAIVKLREAFEKRAEWEQKQRDKFAEKAAKAVPEAPTATPVVKPPRLDASQMTPEPGAEDPAADLARKTHGRVTAGLARAAMAEQQDVPGGIKALPGAKSLLAPEKATDVQAIGAVPKPTTPPQPVQAPSKPVAAPTVPAVNPLPAVGGAAAGAGQAAGAVAGAAGAAQGTVAAGTGAGGAVAGAAAIAGPAIAVVAVVGAAAAALAVLTKGALALDGHFRGLGEKLGDFSGALAVAQARTVVKDTMHDLSSARNLGDRLAANENAREDIKLEVRRLTDTLTKMGLDAMLPLMEGILPILENISLGVEAVQLKIEEWFADTPAEMAKLAKDMADAFGHAAEVAARRAEREADKKMMKRFIDIEGIFSGGGLDIADLSAKLGIDADTGEEL